ncbi:hypothetical protein AVEN_98115-1, partial [Araneus ventricosus]
MIRCLTWTFDGDPKIMPPPNQQSNTIKTVLSNRSFLVVTCPWCSLCEYVIEIPGDPLPEISIQIYLSVAKFIYPE